MHLLEIFHTIISNSIRIRRRKFSMYFLTWQKQLEQIEIVFWLAKTVKSTRSSLRIKGATDLDVLMYCFVTSKSSSYPTRENNRDLRLIMKLMSWFIEHEKKLYTIIHTCCVFCSVRVKEITWLRNCIFTSLESKVQLMEICLHIVLRF